jgi:hypothetical protein
MRTRATTEGRSRTIDRVSRLIHRQRARGRRRTKRAMKTMDLKEKRVSCVDGGERERDDARCQVRVPRRQASGQGEARREAGSDRIGRGRHYLGVREEERSTSLGKRCGRKERRQKHSDSIPRSFRALSRFPVRREQECEQGSERSTEAKSEAKRGRESQLGRCWVVHCTLSDAVHRLTSSKERVRVTSRRQNRFLPSFTLSSSCATAEALLACSK